MDRSNGRSQCYSCRPCKAEQGLVEERPCTTVRDSACAVLDGFYCQATNQESGCTLAQIHARCKPGQATRAPGTRTNDTVCENCETGFYSPDGINCTRWNICVDGEVEQHEGSQTKDVVCLKAPLGRHHYVVMLPVLLTGVVVAGLLHGIRSGRQ
ncbi:unnamed protein product [Lota lota]